MGEYPPKLPERPGKPRGAHRYNRLNDKAVRAAKPGYHADGGGLYLKVDPSGARRWCLRVMTRGRRREVGLGGYPLFSLAEAREAARELRKLAKSGQDPVAARRARIRPAGVPTFEEAARKVHADRAGSYRNPKSSQNWIRSLENHAFPLIGAKRVDEIETPDVLAVLAPIWLTYGKTARHVRQRISIVMDWAKAAGHRSGDNPCDGVTKGLPAQKMQVRHFEALPYAEIPELVRDVRTLDALPATRLAIEFAILTAARSGEVIGARFDEIDFENRTWSRTADRMKNDRPHRVPLSDRAMEILAEARETSLGGPYIFTGARAGKHVSGNTLTKALQRLRPKMTLHGTVRSGFRDWASERTSFPPAVVERALAHIERDATVRAYHRTDLFQKRAELMAVWAEFVTGGGGEVVVLPTARRSA